MNVRCGLCNAWQAILHEVDYPWVARAIRGWPGSATGPERSQALHGSATGPEQIRALHNTPLGVTLESWHFTLRTSHTRRCTLRTLHTPPSYSQRLYARPRDSGELEEILTRERFAHSTRLRAAATLRPGQTAETQEWGAGRHLPGTPCRGPAPGERHRYTVFVNSAAAIERVKTDALSPGQRFAIAAMEVCGRVLARDNEATIR